MDPHPDEDLARADYYAVLSRLFYAPPDQALLTALSSSKRATSEGAVMIAWNALCAAAATTSVEEGCAEYETLFVAVGRPRVVLYASWHLTGFMMEKPLARLRSDLANLGLARSRGTLEPEDHFAALMDTMRHLVLDGSRSSAEGIALQQRFFSNHILTWHESLCDAIEAQPEASVYRHAAAFARAFFELEKTSLYVCIS